MSALSYTGTPGNDSFTGASPSGYTTVDVEMLAGNDFLSIDADISIDLNVPASSLGIITLGSGEDRFLATNTVQVDSLWQGVSVDGGSGNDFMRLRYRLGRDFTLTGGTGNDYIQLSSSLQDIADITAAGPNTPPGIRAGAVYTDFFIGGGEETDKVYLDNTVKEVSFAKINLGNNNNSISGPSLDFFTDLIAGTTADTFLDYIGGTSPDSNGIPTRFGVGLEGMLVQSLNVSTSAFRGNEGVDVLLFDLATNTQPLYVGPSYNGTFARNTVNGGSGDDILAFARNLDRNTVQGGQGDDNFFWISGTLRFNKANGNKNSDTFLVGDILNQESSLYGGEGDDVMTILDAVSTKALYSGDKDSDRINYFAANSTDATLRGGEGNDIIDDFSLVLTGVGTVIEGDDGDDILRQAANLLLNGVTDFGSTLDGGRGADVMTGDLSGGTGITLQQNATNFVSAQAQLQNSQGDFGTYILNNKVIGDASSDLFRFVFGDSDMDVAGNGRDQITDFDSDRSLYWDADGPTNGGGLNAPNFYNAGAILDTQGGDGTLTGLWALDSLQRDVIELVDGVTGEQQTIVINNAGLSQGAPGVLVNDLGLVTSGVGNIEGFIDAGSSLTTEGAAIMWNGTPRSTTLPQPRGDEAQPVTAYLFISNGNGTLDSEDLLIELTNVAATSDSGGLILQDGRITNII